MMHPFRLVLVAGFALVSGCGGLLQSGAPPVQVYVLRPAAVAGAAAAVDGALAVPQPLVQPGLDSARIALTRPGNRLDYFAGASWGAPLPQVVSALAAETLRASGRFALVAEGGRAGGAPYQLQLTVRRFEAEYPDDGATPPRAHVAFECLLTQRAPRKVLGRCDADAVVPAGANRMGAIVQALEKAAQQALAQVVDQAAAAARSVPAGAAPAGG